MIYQVRLTDIAEADLRNIYDWISERASPSVARGYIHRILGYLKSFEHFPARGTLRDEILPGLRIVGFERRVSVAFVVEEREVVVLRLLYGGQPLALPEGLG